MYIAFNELSVHSAFYNDKSMEQAREIINRFVIFIKDLKNRGLIEGIIASDYIYSYHVVENYGFSEWLSDPSVDRIHRQFFRVYLGKYCSYIDKRDLDGEFRIKIHDNTLESIGCVFAIENEDSVISLETDEYWKTASITGEYIKMNESGGIESMDYTVNNLFAAVSLETLKNTYRENIYKNISSGQDLWEQREILYPNLVFCESVKAQLYNDPEKFHIIKIMQRLQELQNYFSIWYDKYNPKELGMNARTESDSVKTNPDLKKYRLFRLPDGREEYFFDHIGFCGKFSGGRIYFLPSKGEGKCYIGYIGRHLPTKKF